jgi:Tfp pilus assembly major pilin PilA
MDMKPATITPPLLPIRRLLAARRAPRSKQHGVGFITLCLYFVVGGVMVLAGLKLLPHYIEYVSAKKVMEAMATSEQVKTGSVAEIRNNFDQRRLKENIQVLKGADLDITKENNATIVSAAWQAQVALFPGYTLLIDFAVSTAPGK